MGHKKLIGKWWVISLLAIIMAPLFLTMGRGEKRKESLENISVTRVKVEPVENGDGVVAIAKVMLNECIVVEEIKVMKVDKKTVLKFPEYISKKGIAYPQIKFLTEESRKCVFSAIETGKPSAHKANQVSFKITDWFRLRRAGKRKVNAEVTFNNVLAISCGVMEGKNGMWIAWPSRPPKEGRGRWKRQIYIRDEKVRGTVESLLLTKYRTMLQEEGEDW